MQLTRSRGADAPLHAASTCVFLSELVKMFVVLSVLILPARLGDRQRFASRRLLESTDVAAGDTSAIFVYVSNQHFIGR